jgi:hypothetical protein
MAVEERTSEKPDGRYYVTVGEQVRGPFDASGKDYNIELAQFGTPIN